MEKIYIIDASGFLYRAYFAIQVLSNSKGESTNALFGFVRSLFKLIKEVDPQYMVIVFDGKNNKASRLKLYSEYKAHRKPTPEDLIQQIEASKVFCDKIGAPILSIDGVEADDTIASVALWAKKQGFQSYILTADKDLTQIVDDMVFLMNPFKENKIIDRDAVLEAFGVPPEKMQDYLAIVGDASDNIPGIEGFGPKTAVDLLNRYGSLEKILEAKEEFSGKKRTTLENQSEIALLSKQLVQLDTTVAFPESRTFFKKRNGDLNELRTFLLEKGFTSILNTIEQVQNQPLQEDYRIIATKEELKELVIQLKKSEVLYIDTETTDTHPLRAELVGIGIASHEGPIYYIPVNGSISLKDVVEELQPLFLEGHSFVGHNIKYDLHVLEGVGLFIKKIKTDTILASYLLNAHERKHSLDELTLQYFGVKKIATESLLGKGKNQKTMKEVPIEDVARYCSEDVAYTRALEGILTQEIASRNLTQILEEIELPLIPILAKMEKKGILVDVQELNVQSVEVTACIKEIEQEIFSLAGVSFNLNSPKQLSEVLFDKLGLPLIKKGKTMPATSADVLETLAVQYPIAGKVLEYRSMEKLRSTYIDAIPLEIDPVTKRVHCQFNQSTAATGRLSCQNPNLQNIPIRTDMGRRIRRAFKPEGKNISFLSSDYSQIELRILAHITEDPALVHAFQNDEDVHARTAAEVFQVPLSEVTKEMRYQAKAVNFGILYGQQAFGLAKEIGVSIKEANTFIQTYFERYKRVKEYIESLKEQAVREGKVRTLTGRERLLPDSKSRNPQLKAASDRLAVNTPFQGTAADIIKMAMIAVDRWIVEEKPRVAMLLQIHDELLFEVDDDILPYAEKEIKRCMETVFPLKVPLAVTISVGKNWEEC